MAPFRSSRSTRNNDPATLNRGRGGVIDHDPTEGLPVRNWYLAQINIKQDEPAVIEDDQQPSANTINPDYPWQELRLPSFYSELPALAQQIVRVARSGRPVKPSIYDKKTGTYISHAEYATRNTLKSKHLENLDSPAAEDDDDMDDDLDVKAEMEKQERAFALNKWAQIPPAVADRRPEPKYLADRRPGMRSLYGFQAAVLNPALNVVATGAAAAGLDLGDGSGLGDATGVLATGMDMPPMAVTPAKRMPPKRRKKGGPGRKRAHIGPGPQRMRGTAGAEGTPGEGVMASGTSGQSSDTVKGDGDIHMEDAHDGEDDKGDDGSGSEEEGSEEGEIDEHHPHDTDMKLEDNVAEPAAHTATEIATEPATEPATKPTTEPVIEPTIQPATEPTLEPAAKPATEPPTEPATEPATAPATEPATEPPVTEPITEPITEAVTGSGTEPAAEPATKPIEPEAPTVQALVSETPAAEMETPVPEAISPTELVPITAVITEEPTPKPESVSEPVLPEPVLVPVVPEVAETSEPKVDFLKSLNDAVADQEKEE